MKTGVILLNFGEPEHATEAEVVPFLERIFTVNASLDASVTSEQVRARSADLARRRAPGLIEAYHAIGGSPLNAQARSQAQSLERELTRRGHDVVTTVGMQFSDPSIPSAVAALRDLGVQRLLALPIYPLCGPSTTVAALAEVSHAVAESGWTVELLEVTGWHSNTLYTELRASGVRSVATRHTLNLDTDAMLVFSAHGTPLKYLREGSRYALYVRDSCARVAANAGATRYVIGYQNHSNRPVEWTQPDIAEAIRRVEANSIIVVPISFMHEQSETLAELDIELRQVAEDAGLTFYRVPVPHEDPRFVAVLADIVEERVRGGLLPCRCRSSSAARCLAAAI